MTTYHRSQSPVTKLTCLLLSTTMIASSCGVGTPTTSGSSEIRNDETAAGQRHLSCFTTKEHELFGTQSELEIAINLDGLAASAVYNAAEGPQSHPASDPVAKATGSASETAADVSLATASGIPFGKLVYSGTATTNNAPSTHTTIAQGAATLTTADGASQTMECFVVDSIAKSSADGEQEVFWPIAIGVGVGLAVAFWPRNAY
mgnify:CR=1 FL=1